MGNKITHNSKQYELGKIYRSSEGYIGTLDGVDEHRFIIGNGIDHRTCLAIEEIDESDMGTITTAPIELEEGCWYMTKEGFVFLFVDGFWRKNAEDRSVIGGRLDFTPLYKMERAK